MIIHIGENPSNQISSAETTGIHMLYRLIRADFAIVNVGAAIKATTAGRIPLNIRSTMTLSLKLWKNSAMARIMINDGSTVPNAVMILPRIPFNLYPMNIEIFTASIPGADCEIANKSIKSSWAIHFLFFTISFSISGTIA